MNSDNINFGSLTQAQSYWLNDVERLSQSLSNNFSNWNIILHYCGNIIPSNDEILSLASNIDDFYGRIITHNIGDEVFILGKVIVSNETYIAFRDKLDALNSRSIGDEILFVEPMYRRDFTVDKIRKTSLSFLGSLNDSEIYQKMPDFLLVRNSIFVSKLNQDHKFLVKEYFVKDIVKNEAY